MRTSHRVSGLVQLLICDLFTDKTRKEKYANVIKVIGESLTGLYRAVQSARENKYLWERMLAPAPLFDLDTAVLVGTVIGVTGKSVERDLQSAIPDDVRQYAESFFTAVEGLTARHSRH